MYMQETQGNHGDFQHSSGYAVPPENDGASVTGVLADFSRSLSKTTTQPYVLKGSCGGLQTARMMGSGEVVAKRNTFTTGLSSYVNRTKNNLLSSDDIEYMKFIADRHKFKHDFYDSSTKDFLTKLPVNLREKLTVIVSTHEENELPYYGRSDDKYPYNTFVFGATENGALIIDLDNKYYESAEMLMLGGEFFSKAFKPIIKRTLGFIEYVYKGYEPTFLKKHLPELRLISSQTYVENWKNNRILELTAPYNAQKNNPDCLKSQLCKGSYRLNIFEFFSLVNNEKSMSYLVKNYTNTPIDRLGIDSKDSDIPDTLIKKLKDISR